VSLVEAAGWFGMAGILVGYFSFMSGRISLRWFHACNLLAGVALVLHAAAHSVWPFVALNGVYSLIAAVGLLRSR